MRAGPVPFLREANRCPTNVAPRLSRQNSPSVAKSDSDYLGTQKTDVNCVVGRSRRDPFVRAEGRRRRDVPTVLPQLPRSCAHVSLPSDRDAKRRRPLWSCVRWPVYRFEDYSEGSICEGVWMKTIVELPDELFHQAEASAALQGRALKDLVADGLKLLLQKAKTSPVPAPLRRTQFPIIKPKDPARKLTPEMVAAAEEQLLSEEAAAHGRLAGH